MGFQDLVVSLQLSVTLFELSIRDPATFDVASNLVLFLISLQVILDPEFLASLLVQLLQFLLQSGFRQINLFFHLLDFILFVVKSDLGSLKLISQLGTVVIHDPQLVVEDFFVLVGSLFIKLDLFLCDSVSLLQLHLLRLIREHTLLELIDGFA